MDHPILLHALVFLFYFAGAALHTLSKAVAQAKATKTSVGAYMRERAWQVAGRKFFGFCAFLIIWDNPALVGLTEFVTKIGFFSTVGAGGILGWFSDSVAEKFQKKVGLSDSDAGNGEK